MTKDAVIFGGGRLLTGFLACFFCHALAALWSSVAFACAAVAAASEFLVGIAAALGSRALSGSVGPRAPFGRAALEGFTACFAVSARVTGMLAMWGPAQHFQSSDEMRNSHHRGFRGVHGRRSNQQQQRRDAARLALGNRDAARLAVVGLAVVVAGQFGDEERLVDEQRVVNCQNQAVAGLRVLGGHNLKLAPVRRLVVQEGEFAVRLKSPCFDA